MMLFFDDSSTLGAALQRSAGRNPQKIAVFCGDRSITYKELDRSSSLLAGWLLAQGLNPGDRVAIHWPNAIETVQLFFAAAKAGLIAVPVNLRLKSAEIEYVLAHSGAVLCFIHPAMAAALDAAARFGCPARTALPDLSDEAVLLPAVSADSHVLIMYTSGTTARPKGVLHTQQTMVASASLSAQGLELVEDDSMLTALPMMHIAALCCAVIPSLLRGATVVLVPAFEPGAVLDAIQRFRCTILPLLPALMQFVIVEQERFPRDTSSLRLVATGGDSTPLSTQQRACELFAAPYQEIYALTEAVPLIISRKDQSRHGAIGQALTELRVVDLAGRDVPDGVTGELIARGPNNCIGYWNDPAATAEVLRDGWLYSGDLAERDSDGYFSFRGRLKQIIIRAGSNISPQEVEEVLYQHPAVLEAGVIGKPDPIYGETVAAFVSLRPGAKADEAELKEFARQRLAEYKTPETVIILPELPKGLTGKVLRRGLKDLLSNASHA